MRPSKAMTIRLPADQAEKLETVASVDDMPVVEVIRVAVDQYIHTRTQDEVFQRNLRKRLERAQAMLGESESGSPSSG